MIIVSQDKRDILNLNFTQRIGLDNETNFSSIVAYQNGNASAECLWLGSYATEERAKEVLSEIIKCYEMTEFYKVAAGADQEYIQDNSSIFKYEMPEA